MNEDELDELYDAIKHAVELLVCVYVQSKQKKALPEYTNSKKRSARFEGLVGTCKQVEAKQIRAILYSDLVGHVYATGLLGQPSLSNRHFPVSSSKSYVSFSMGLPSKNPPPAMKESTMYLQ